MGVIADLSYFQGPINFDALKGAVDGVIIRVQAGSTFADPNYAHYVSECKRVGLPFGTYAYFRGINVPDAIQEAKDAYTRMDKESLCFALDIEEVSMADLVAGGQAFIDYMKQQGVKNVGLYSGEYFFRDHNLSAIRCDWHWIANYGVNDGQQHNKPNLPDVEVWQFTSVGHLAGINGNVDEDVIVGGFNPFGNHSIVAPTPANNDYQFCTKQTIMQTLRCDGHTDIRTAPSHTAPYVRDTQAGEIFHVFDKVIAAQGHCWDNLGGANWVDEASGIFYWLDNPALQKAQNQPSVSTYVVKHGDTLSEIAVAHGMSLSQIVSMNGISDPNKIYEGQVLKVSGSQSQQSVPQPVYYKIQTGDALSIIATKFGTPMSQIQAWNNIKNPNLIQAGASIRVK